MLFIANTIPLNWHTSNSSERGSDVVQQIGLVEKALIDKSTENYSVRIVRSLSVRLVAERRKQLDTKQTLPVVSINLNQS